MSISNIGTMNISAGEITVIANTWIGHAVSIHIDGNLDIRLPLTASQARALAAQLIAAADYAEGKA